MRSILMTRTGARVGWCKSWSCRVEFRKGGQFPVQSTKAVGLGGGGVVGAQHVILESDDL